MWRWIRYKTCDAPILNLDEYNGVKTRSPVVIIGSGECLVSFARSEGCELFSQNSVDSVYLHNFLQKEYWAVTGREIGFGK